MLKDEGISELFQLTTIYANYNHSITNLNPFKKLTKIYIGGNCGVNDAGISELSLLTKIHIRGNLKITDLTRFKNLKEVFIGENQPIKVNDNVCVFCLC